MISGKFFAVYLLLWIFLAGICTGIGYSQCPQPVVWMEKIVAAESSAALPAEKIGAFEELASHYIKCNTTKDSLYARIVHRLGDLYRKTGDFEKGIKYTQEAVAINSHNTPGAQKDFLAHSYYNLGLYYKLLYFFEESHSYFDSCIYIAEKYPAKTFIALMAFEQESFSFFKTGDYQKSIEVADRGKLFANKVQDTLFEAILLTQKAQSQLALNQINAAEENIKQAMQILTSGSMPTAYYLASSYSIYADLFQRKKNFPASVAYYKKAFDLNLQQENFQQCSRDMLDMGFLYEKDLNDPIKAMVCYIRGVQLLQRAPDAYQLATLYNNMGVLHWRQKDYRKALGYFQKGLTVLPLQFSDTAWKSNPSQAMLKFVANDYFVTTLLANKGESLLALYKKEENKDHLTDALHAFRTADKMVDQMRWKQQSEQSKVFWREKTKKMYEDAIETCYLLKDAEQAFFFFEKSRAVLLNDKLSELGARKYLSPQDLTRERELRIKVFSLQQELSSYTEASAPFNATRQKLYVAQETLEKFIKALEKRYPVYYHYKYDTTIYTIKDIRSGLLKNTASLVEYFTGDSLIYILAIVPNGATLSRVGFNDYLKVTRTLLSLCSDKARLNQNYSSYHSVANQLYKKLFEPLHIQTSSVIISQDDHFIPFEMLLTDPKVSTSFLLKDHAFSYTYSAAYLMRNSKDNQPLNSTLLGIAPVHYEPYLHQQSLQGADNALDNIRSYFSSVTFLIKEAATKKKFLSVLPRYPIVHLYSHADADSTGNEPVLYLYDSVLRVSELQTLHDLQTKLIVLSACNTGIGKSVRGEGIFSLARGFSAAGVPAIVTTLWQIDNQSTYQLTGLFYKYLHTGITMDKALQQAKLEFLRNHDREKELPYYWAANVLIGQTSMLKKEQTSFLPYTFGVLFIVTISVLIFYKRKRSSI